ncbi:hypothetical protein EDC96DRAFT_524047, partial [Choanephora cucurbitarum]
MPTKPVDRKVKKGKKEKIIMEKSSSVSESSRDSPKVKVVQTKSKIVPLEKRAEHKKKRKSFPRRVLSWSIAAYLGYYAFAGCGSPLDQNSEKPAVCGPIDTLKLDANALFENKIYPHAYPIYMSKLHPYVSPAANKAMAYYEQYGIPAQTQLIDYYKLYGAPAQTRLIEYYDQHGKPMVNQASARVKEIYQEKVAPSASLYLNQAKTVTEPHLEKMQLLAQQQWDNAPPHVKRAFYSTIKAIQDWYKQAESTDLVPILIEFYYKTIDFFQYQLWPAIQSNPLTYQIKSNYDQHAKAYVDLHLKPLWTKYNDHVHLDQLLAHLWAAVPQRPKAVSSSPSPILKDQTVGSSIGQIKTPESAESASEAPAAITTTTAPIVKSVEEALPATPAPVVEQPIIPHQQDKEQTQEKVSTATSFATTHTSQKQAASTISNADIHHNDDIVQEKSISPDSTAGHHNNDQIIVSPTDKDVAPVPQKKQEVAEKKTIPPPQSPTHFNTNENQIVPQEEESKEEDDQVNLNKDQWVVPPVEQETIKEKIVKPVQEKVIEPVQHKIEEIKEKLHAKKEEKERKEIVDSVTKIMEEKAIEPVQDKSVEAVKEELKIEEVKETVKESVKEAVSPKEINDKKEEKTVEPEVAKPIEFDIKKPIEKVIKEPVQKILQKIHVVESTQEEESSKDAKEPIAPVAVDKKRETNPSLKAEQKVFSDDKVSFKVDEHVSKDIPPATYVEREIVAD